MVAPLNPLTWNVPIVNKDGTPTQEFMRKWQLQIAVNAAATGLTTEAQVSAILDILGNTSGSVLVRNSLRWDGLDSPSDGTKFLSGTAVPGWAKVKDSDLAMTDTTLNNATSTRHGFTPKSPANATQFLNGAADPTYAQVKDSDIAFSDITTNNATAARHGFLAKLSGTASTYMNGSGAWTTPASGLTDLYVDGNDVLTGGGIMFFDFGGV